MLEKKQERLGKSVKFSIEFSSKIDLKSTSKSGKTAFATKIASGAVSRLTFFASGLVFGRFWTPGRDPKSTQNRPFKKNLVDFLARKIAFLNFRRSGVFRMGPGRILETPGTVPDPILIGFLDTFLLVPCGFLVRFVGFRRGLFPDLFRMNG